MRATLTQEEQDAISAAIAIHGRNAKAAIRQAWHDGNYRRQSLSGWDSTLQRLRNREGGREAFEAFVLASLRRPR